MFRVFWRIKLELIGKFLGRYELDYDESPEHSPNRLS
jgi:hypothetical protein